MLSKTITCLTVGIIVYMLVYNICIQKDQSTRIKTRLLVTTIWLIAITAWPLAWRMIVDTENLTPYALVGVIWPVLILSFDLFAMRQHTYDDQLQSKRQYMTMDANAICSLTFAISAFIGAQRHPCCNRIFLWAILGCVAFIMPAPHVNVNAMETIAFEAIQKAVLAYATGLLLSGVMIVSADQVSEASSGTIKSARSAASSSSASSSSSELPMSIPLSSSSSSSADLHRFENGLRDLTLRLREAADSLDGGTAP